MIVKSLYESEPADGVYSMTAKCGKKTATVIFCPNGVRVCCHNAAHKSFGTPFNGGKFFRDVDDAINGYKSPEIKAIIQSALRHIEG